MKLLAGIDGGGTRTRLALVDQQGVLAAFVEAGCCSFVELGIARAKRALLALWNAAWKAADKQPRPVAALFIGTGSILSRGDERTNCEIALSLRMAPRGKVRAGNDALNALAGALNGRPGILLISGTGSACFGRNQRGATWRAGGWGHLLHDAGSAYAIGESAIIAATREADGRGPRTALTALVRDGLQITDLADIYRKVHHQLSARAQIASLAPKVIACAQAGDLAATQILQQGAAGLAEMIVTVARKLKLKRPELALTGGLITNSAHYRKMLLDQLNHALPGFSLATRGLAPVFGAVMLAYEQAHNAKPTPAFLAALRASSATVAVYL